MSRKQKPLEQQASFRRPIGRIDAASGATLEFNFVHYEDGTKVVSVWATDSDGDTATLTYTNDEIQQVVEALGTLKANIQFELQRKIEAPPEQIELPERNKWTRPDQN